MDSNIGSEDFKEYYRHFLIFSIDDLTSRILVTRRCFL